MIGAWQDDDNGSGSGSAYIYFNKGVFIEEENLNLHSDKMLFVNFPNPFATSTTIKYELKYPETVRIVFYNQVGKQMDVIEKRQQKGLNQIEWVPDNLPSGIYYFRLKAGQQVTVGKLVLMR